MDSRLREIGKQVKIKGFRPGRIPPKVLKQRYGKSVQQEIVAELVQSSVFDAIEKESLRPAANPVIEDLPDFADEGDFRFTASVEVYPDIPVIETSEVSINRPKVEVTEADVDDMLETLREQRQSWHDVDGPAADGHQVTVEYVAETSAGKVPEQGKQRLAVQIGSSGFDALESELRGMQAGDKKQVELTFPEGYGERKLAGQSAQVELETKQVQRAELPEVDEEFVKSFAIESGSLEDLRAEVRNNLERELEQATKSYLKQQLVRSLLSSHGDLEVPESIVRQEMESMRKRAAQARGEDPESIPTEALAKPAQQRVRSGLLIAELARQNNLVIDGARVRKAVETVAETYEQPREVVQMYYGNQQLLQSVENLVLEEQVVDWVMDHAKVTDKPMSFKEVIGAAAATGQQS
ncbi:MAG: trigger factor, partial [Xanthomonadales bacterium]|nr:trigger factor [Xanthomonadales bacterium]